MTEATPVKLLNFYNYRIVDGEFLADNYWEEEEPYKVVQLYLDGSNGNVYVDYIDPNTGDIKTILQREGYRSQDMDRVYGKTI